MVLGQAAGSVVVPVVVRAIVDKQKRKTIFPTSRCETSRLAPICHKPYLDAKEAHEATQLIGHAMQNSRVTSNSGASCRFSCGVLARGFKCRSGSRSTWRVGGERSVRSAQMKASGSNEADQPAPYRSSSAPPPPITHSSAYLLRNRERAVPADFPEKEVDVESMSVIARALYRRGPRCLGCRNTFQ